MCHSERKTRISAEHVLKAIEELEFNFGDKLEECLKLYKEEYKERKTSKTLEKQEESENMTTDEHEDNDE